MERGAKARAAWWAQWGEDEAEAARAVAAVVEDVAPEDYLESEDDTRLVLRAMALARLGAMLTGAAAALMAAAAVPRVRVVSGGETVFDLAEELSRRSVEEDGQALDPGGDEVVLDASTDGAFLQAAERVGGMIDAVMERLGASTIVGLG